jgi:hypothetical protein
MEGVDLREVGFLIESFWIVGMRGQLQGAYGIGLAFVSARLRARGNFWENITRQVSFVST